MALAAKLLSLSLRPVAAAKLHVLQSQVNGVSYHFSARRGRTSPVVRADRHHKGKIRDSFVTRASTSGSSFRGASGELSQPEIGKGPEAVPQSGELKQITQPSPTRHLLRRWSL